MAPPNSHNNMSPRVISGSEHGIDRSKISPGAVEVVERLKADGYSSELVGGCVRDLLLERQPKDFDVATDARPEQVRRLFRNCDVFGRRFQIAAVYLRGEVIEVATYRRKPAQPKRRGRSRNVSAKGKILKDNQFGQIKEDAFRRDFTINSLYLDPATMEVVDYTGGYDDAMQRIVRTIGNPTQRFREDPVRILRAIRFVTLPDFDFDVETEKALSQCASLLSDVSNYRLADELSKMLFNGRAQAILDNLHEHEILRHLFPPYGWIHSRLPDNHRVIEWIRMTLIETDDRIQRGEHISQAYTYAAILWPKFNHIISKRSRRQHSGYGHVAKGILDQQKERTFITRHMRQRIEDIWLFQRQLEIETIKGGIRFAKHKTFRSAVRLFELRAKFGEVDEQICKDWVELRDQQASQQPRVRRRYRRQARWR